MSGLYEHGQIVGARKVKKSTVYNIGDVIVFKVGKVKIIHEIVGVVDGNYKTQGVNNKLEDPWTVSKKDIVGKVDLSQAELDAFFLRVEQGKTTVAEALGLEAFSDLSSSYVTTRCTMLIINAM